jgi:hypothetical protein
LKPSRYSTNPNYNNGLILNSRGNVTGNHTRLAKQRRISSLIEATANTVIGYGIAFGGQLIVYPWLGIEVSLGQNMLIGGIFTVLSMLRGFLVRRMFEHWRVTGILR